MWYLSSTPHLECKLPFVQIYLGSQGLQRLRSGSQTEWNPLMLLGLFVSFSCFLQVCSYLSCVGERCKHRFAVCCGLLNFPWLSIRVEGRRERLDFYFLVNFSFKCNFPVLLYFFFCDTSTSPHFKGQYLLCAPLHISGDFNYWLPCRFKWIK